MLRRLLWIPIACMAADWPAWRGADGLGTVNDKQIPLRWSKTENVKWRVALPEPGNSTPIVHGNSVFVTQPRKERGLRSLLCFDRATGEIRWERSLEWKDAEPTHATNPYASSSPVTDGERVIAWFGSAGIAAFDIDGKQLWHRDLGRQRHTWGYASSPVIHGDLVFLNFGPGDRAFLIALDKRTGKTAWQVDIAAGEGAKYANWDAKDMYGSWSTPLVHDGKLIVSHARRVAAYDPATGKQLWSAEGMGDLVYPSPVVGSGVIVAAGGFQGASLGLALGGERLWRLEKSKGQIGSGVIVGEHLYIVDQTGIAHCIKVKTGEIVWSQRLNGAGEDGGVWSSPVLHQGRILVMNKSGDTFVFQAKPEFELLGVNSLGEPSNSSVVVAGGEIFLRTHEALWCLAAK
ncbi:MAG: PQQ-binding-like beta-propeller repeat protein [Bryobacteraceae bacterium]